MFARLLLAQWVAGIGAALWISPKTWIGAASQTHWHVWAAIFLGGAITGFPVLLAWKLPGASLTRHTIAVAQMLSSALLIHLTGGRVETHFHVFGSLAFLAFYRDWRVLLSATVVVAADHMARGIFWPQSVFGVLTASPWRWIEHAAWVVFEDTFLFISIRQSIREMLAVSAHRAELEGINARIERQVLDRTAELTDTHKQLVETSRQAGRAEVATGVLHNVGNVLNSVNVSSAMVAQSLKNSRASNLSKVVALLRDHESDLGGFFTSNPKGKQLPAYLSELANHVANEQAGALKELGQLQKDIDHIKDIVAMQQNFARVTGVAETIQINELVEDALRMNSSSFLRHDVHIVQDLAEGPAITTEKHKVLQILVNLITNAKHACQDSDEPEHTVTIRARYEKGLVRVSVSDNGVGISPENLSRIFNHGFTTKKTGHGFGLHSGALTARELGGSLSVHSEGLGRGATFTVELPLGGGAVSNN